MEVKFLKRQISCLRPILTQIQSQEQTQELKLPDGFPDIGRILGCWGQPVIRGKDWRRTSMNVSGGVMAWVLYAPEDGSQARVIDSWIPFQARWEFPESYDDGRITVKPLLSNLDARNVSARKMIVRTGVDIMGQALESAKEDVSIPGNLPEDVQLLVRNYPIDMPVEAGEKQIQIEENFALPDSDGMIQRLISYTLMPVVQDAKVLANRLVMRGNAVFKVRYLTQDGSIRTWSADVPFSEYTELDRDYDANATAWTMPILTGLEVDLTEDMHLLLRAGIAVQYTVFERAVLEVAEDAYSPYRDVTLQSESVKLPVLLDQRDFEISLEGSSDASEGEVVDMEAFSKHPQLRMDEDGMCICISGGFQILKQGDELPKTEDTVRFEGSTPYPSASENQTQFWFLNATEPECNKNDGKLNIRSSASVKSLAYSGKAIEMIQALNLGEYKESSSEKPSIILRRVNEDSLWTLAKKCGSTVDAIRAANHLDNEPEDGAMLLIPVC